MSRQSRRLWTPARDDAKRSCKNTLSKDPARGHASWLPEPVMNKCLLIVICENCPRVLASTGNRTCQRISIASRGDNPTRSFAIRRATPGQVAIDRRRVFAHGRAYRAGERSAAADEFIAQYGTCLGRRDERKKAERYRAKPQKFAIAFALPPGQLCQVSRALSASAVRSMISASR